MGRRAAVVLYVLALVAVVVGVDVLFFRNQFWDRLIVNVGIVLLFAAFYLRFLKRPLAQPPQCGSPSSTANLNQRSSGQRTPATARRCRYSHGLIRRLITVTDREGVVLSSGACIGMPPAVGCPTIPPRHNARNRDSRHRAVVDAATAHVTVTADLDSVRAADVIAALIKRCRTVLTERCYITK